jgi:hypothetical protein
MTSQQDCYISRFTFSSQTQTHHPPIFSASVCQTTQFSASTRTATTFHAPTHSPPFEQPSYSHKKNRNFLFLSLSLSLLRALSLVWSFKDFCWKILRASVDHQGSRREILTEAFQTTSLQQLFIFFRCVLQRCTCLNTAQGFGFAPFIFLHGRK